MKKRQRGSRWQIGFCKIGLEALIVRPDLACKGPGCVLGDAGVEILFTTEPFAK
jgi:hypothetical protein